MPFYSYRCQSCRKRFDVRLSYDDYGKTAVQCPDCQSDDVFRRIESVRIARSGRSRLEDLSPEQVEGLEDDPRALGRMMRQMGDEMGEDLGPEFDEVVSRLEKGEDPEQISQDLPDPGGDIDAGEEL